jgi:hypothetical protein
MPQQTYLLQGQIKNKGVPLFFIFCIFIFLYFCIFILGSRQRYHLIRSRKLSLEEVNGKCDFFAHATTHAKVLVAGLNERKRRLVVPRAFAVEQSAELFHHLTQPLFGELQPLFVSALFLAVHGIVQVALLVKVQHDAVARLEQARRAARHAFVAHDAEVSRANFLVGLRGFSGLHGWLGYYVG